MTLQQYRTRKDVVREAVAAHCLGWGVDTCGLHAKKLTSLAESFYDSGVQTRSALIDALDAHRLGGRADPRIVRCVRIQSAYPLQRA